MSLSHVIALGHIAYWPFLWSNWWTYAGGIIALALFILFCYCIETDWFGMGAVSIVSLFIIVISIFAPPSDQQDAAIAQWKHAYAYPYIASLPVRRHDIVYIKVQDTSQVDGGEGLFTFYVSSWDLTHVLVLYKVGDRVNKADITAKLSMRLSPTAQPYITYQRLPHSLGDGVHAGLYNVTIHLPRDYKFQTIQ